MTDPSLSIVIPTLNAAGPLARTLAAIGTRDGVEIVVADGGSTDDTVAVAEKAGATVVSAAKGRGSQLAAGVAAATGTGLLMLHADTLLPPDWRGEVTGFLESPAATTGAAAFRLRFDADSAGAHRVAAMANWRSRALGLPYGDQGLVLTRALYDRIGGYRPIPLMEDVDLVRRIGRANLHLLDGAVITSAARYRRGGWVRRPLRNLLLLTLYFLGVPPRLLAKHYG